MSEQTPLLPLRRPWRSWEKIALRLLFPFITLQILTQDFTGNLFGRTFPIWQWGEEIFTPPALWLNRHIFHFHYLPASWTSFSGALHTIRDIVYLLLSGLICLIWSLLDRSRREYDKLLYWFSEALVVPLGCIVFAYGSIKVFPVQMGDPSFAILQKKVGDLSPFDLLWTAYGYGRPYQVFTGCCEVMGALLILFRRTRIAGLLVIVSVMVNVILLNYTFSIGVLWLSSYILLVALFLLAPSMERLIRFFFSWEPVTLQRDSYLPARSKTTILLRVVAIGVILTSFILNTQLVYGLFKRRETARRSAQYSMVRHFIVNGDSLRAAGRDTLSWQSWSERTSGGKRYVTIVSNGQADGTTYTVDRDTGQHLLSLRGLDAKDTSVWRFSYRDMTPTDWRLEGKAIRVDLMRVEPDTLFSLLKKKRSIVTLDDREDHE